MTEVITEILLRQGKEEAVRDPYGRWLGGDGKQPADGRDGGDEVGGGNEGRESGGGKAGEEVGWRGVQEGQRGVEARRGEERREE